jgi:hypothetical protein
VMLTHECKERDLRRALEVLGSADYVAKPTRVLRIQA